MKRKSRRFVMPCSWPAKHGPLSLDARILRVYDVRHGLTGTQIRAQTDRWDTITSHPQCDSGVYVVRDNATQNNLCRAVNRW